MQNNYDFNQNDNENLNSEDQYFTESHIYTEVTPQPVKKRKNGFLRTACLCLAFTIVGATVGGLAVRSTYSKETAQQEENQAASGGGEQSAGDEVNAADTNKEQNDGVTKSTANKVVSDGSEMSPSDIYSLACQQVVGITTEITTMNAFGQQSASSVAGTGFFLTEDGYIATNYHVVSTAVSGNYPINVITYDGETYEATYIGGDSDNDVALLKIEGSGFNAAALADSNDMAVGEDIYVIGNALGELSYTLTSGLVSALDRQINTTDNGVASVMNMFQIDAAVNSGNSGGPVYNSKGQVIGIVTAKYSSTGVEGLGFAIPINDAESLLMDIMENGYVSGKPAMGISMQTVESSVAQMYDMPVGAYVYEVNEGSAAEAAGIQAKDIITKLGDIDVASTSDLSAAVKKYSAGDTTTVTVYRSGQYLELDITFQEKEQTSSTAESEEELQNSLNPFGNNQQNDSQEEYDQDSQGQQNWNSQSQRSQSWGSRNSWYY